MSQGSYGRCSRCQAECFVIDLTALVAESGPMPAFAGTAVNGRPLGYVTGRDWDDRAAMDDVRIVCEPCRAEAWRQLAHNEAWSASTKDGGR